MSWMEGNLVLWSGGTEIVDGILSRKMYATWHFVLRSHPDGGAWWSRRCWFQSETSLGQDRYTSRPSVQIADGGRCEGNFEVSRTFWYSINPRCSRHFFKSRYSLHIRHILCRCIYMNILYDMFIYIIVLYMYVWRMQMGVQVFFPIHS